MPLCITETSLITFSPPPRVRTARAQASSGTAAPTTTDTHLLFCGTLTHLSLRASVVVLGLFASTLILSFMVNPVKL